MRHTLFCLFTILLILQTGNAFAQQKQQSTLPTPDHIVILILENHGYSEIIGSANAPHINVLATGPFSALFTQSFALEHPSQPNYLDFYAGCNQGVTDDGVPGGIPFTTENLGRELLDIGKTFITYSEDLPNVGYNGASANNYARKHNPAANWMGTGTNQIPPTTNQPFSAFPSDFTKLPDVCYVVPNQNNDMHDGSIKTGDSWMNANLNNYIEWAKAHNSLFILTFDEDDYSGSNQVATIFSGAMVKPGQYAETINHYSILRTIEDMYGLPYACNASTASPIIDSWKAVDGVSSQNLSAEKVYSLSSNPSKGLVVIRIEPSKVGKLTNVQITGIRGEKVFEKNIYKTSTQEIRPQHLIPGSYIVRVSDESKEWIEKLIIQ